MMEILFRGRCCITGNWYYGFYYVSKGHHIIRDAKDNECIVLDGSVGMFTGIKCKQNEQQIFSGDVVKSQDEVMLVIWNSSAASFDVEFAGGDSVPMYDDTNHGFSYEIIGNIHEHPELLKQLEK